MLRTVCTSCGRRLKISDDLLAGQIVHCPRCGSMVQVPTVDDNPREDESSDQPDQPGLRLDRGEIVDSQQITADAGNEHPQPRLGEHSASHPQEDSPATSGAAEAQSANRRRSVFTPPPTNPTEIQDATSPATAASAEPTPAPIGTGFESDAARQRRNLMTLIFGGGLIALVAGVSVG
ncbi:MAG: hypothetical protein AAFP90_10910, partial [Planctomycetota bacterium]